MGKNVYPLVENAQPLKSQEPIADKADAFRLPPSPGKRKNNISVLSVP